MPEDDGRLDAEYPAEDLEEEGEPDWLAVGRAAEEDPAWLVDGLAADEPAFALPVEGVAEGRVDAEVPEAGRVEALFRL